MRYWLTSVSSAAALAALTSMAITLAPAARLKMVVDLP